MSENTESPQSPEPLYDSLFEAIRELQTEFDDVVLDYRSVFFNGELSENLQLLKRAMDFITILQKAVEKEQEKSEKFQNVVDDVKKILEENNKSF